MGAPADPTRKVSLCLPPKVLTPSSSPAVSPFPVTPPGVRLTLLGPWHSGRWLPLPPHPTPFSSFSSFSKAGSAPPAGNPAPPPSLPPDRARGTVPAAQSGCQSESWIPPPSAPDPAPISSSRDLGHWTDQRMRAGENERAGWCWGGGAVERVRTAVSGLWKLGNLGYFERQATIVMTEWDIRRDMKGFGRRDPRTLLGESPSFLRPVPPRTPADLHPQPESPTTDPKQLAGAMVPPRGQCGSNARCRAGTPASRRCYWRMGWRFSTNVGRTAPPTLGPASEPLGREKTAEPEGTPNLSGLFLRLRWLPVCKAEIRKLNRSPFSESLFPIFPFSSWGLGNPGLRGRRLHT
jgi:hypothetical protein